MLNGFKRLIRKGALEHINLHRANRRALPLRNELNTFARRIGTLIKLARKWLHCKKRNTFRHFENAFTATCRSHQDALNGELERSVIYLRFTKYRRNTLIKQLICDALNVIHIYDAQFDCLRQSFGYNRMQLLQKLLRLNVETGLLLNIDARDHESYPS
jgi:hypothetical protein